jgi:hypothetical protein
LLTFLLIVPRPIRDAVYRLIATNRYRLFGKREMCMLPTADIRARFLDVISAPGAIDAMDASDQLSNPVK